jgi:hypothetical protein
MVLVGGHHLERIDVLGATAGAGERRCEDLPRQALAARDDPVAGAWLQVIEQTDSGAEIAILARGCVDRREELPPHLPCWHERSHDLAVPPQKGRGCLAHLGPSSGQSLSSALEQQIGDAGERGRNDDEWTLMFRDQDHRFLDLVRRCE